MKRYQVSLPPILHDGKDLWFLCDFETDDNDDLQYIHVWRKGFLGFHAEDVEVVQLDEMELRVVRCKVTSNALLYALFGFISGKREEEYYASLVRWLNRISRIIGIRYPDF